MNLYHFEVQLISDKLLVVTVDDLSAMHPKE